MNFYLLFLEGFLAKVIAGADDTLVHAPLTTLFTKTKKGKLLFISGMFTSILILIIISILFSNFLILIPYRNFISALLIIILAFFIYSGISEKREKKYIESIKNKTKKEKNLFILFFFGMIIFFITGIDDIIIYSTLFANNLPNKLIISTGIIFAAIFELIIVFYFSRLLSKVKSLKKITILGLIALAILIAFKII